MPINITGSTDTTGAVSVLPGKVKVACIIGTKGADVPTAQPLNVFDIYGTTDATSKFGNSVKSTSLVETLIEMGVSLIKGIMVPDLGVDYATTADAYDAALGKLLLVDADVLVLDTMDSTVLVKVKDHLDLAEAEDKPRYAVACATGDNTALTTLASTLNHKRLFVTGPVTTDESTGNAVDPIITAAALAGLICVETDDPALPMNGVEMPGLGGVSRVLLRAEKDALINAGVTPLYTSPSGRPAVYRLVTTYTKDTQNAPDATWQEGTTTFIADDVLTSVQTRIRTNYKRTKNVARILSSMRTDVIDVLSRKADLEIIENFNPKTVSVMKDPTDLYGAIIDYEFDVVTPLYTITIRQHMKL